MTSRDRRGDGGGVGWGGGSRHSHVISLSIGFRDSCPWPFIATNTHYCIIGDGCPMPLIATNTHYRVIGDGCPMSLIATNKIIQDHW